MTKRKYTISDRVLAANRRNLVLARRVDAGVRFRPTPQRAAASRANLVKARAVLRAASLSPDGYRREENESGFRDPVFGVRRICCEGRSANPEPQTPNPERRWFDAPSYGTCFTRGLYAVSLRRSARLAGESAAAFDRHVERFLQALNPKNDGERRLARGIAETVWRRLRVFGAQARWERVGLIYRLREAAGLADGVRDSGFGIRPTRTLEFGIRGSQTGIGSSFCESRNPNPEPRIPNLFSPADLALDLGLDIERIFAIDFRLMESAEKLNARLERLSRRWVEGRGGNGDMFMVAAMPRGRDGKLIDLSPAAMGNPFRRPSAVESALECSAGCDSSLLALFPKLWRRRQWCLPGDPEYRSESNGASMRYRMMHEAAENGKWKSENGNWPCPAEFELDSPEALGGLWEKAVAGMEAAMSKFKSQNSKLKSENAKFEKGDLKPAGANPDLEERDSKAERDCREAGPGILNFDFLILNLWARLNHYRDLAQHEAGEVERLLEQKLAGRMSEELISRLGGIGILPPGARLRASEDGDAGALLMELVLLFNRSTDPEAVRQTQQLNEELKAALYEFLAARFGPAGAGEGFEELMPACVIAAGKTERRRAIRELDRWLAEEEAKHNSQFKIHDSKEPGDRAESKIRDAGERGDLDEAYEACERQAQRSRVIAERQRLAALDTLGDALVGEPIEEEPSWLDEWVVGDGLDPEWGARYFAAVGCGNVGKAE